MAAAAPGSLSENSCTLIPGLPGLRRYPGKSTHLSTPVRKMDAEHVEAMWSLPACGVLRAGPIADGIIVRVRRPGRGGLTRLAVAPPADRRGPRHAFAPPRVARAAQPKADRAVNTGQR